jgi:hypothetical protein
MSCHNNQSIIKYAYINNYLKYNKAAGSDKIATDLIKNMEEEL